MIRNLLLLSIIAILFTSCSKSSKEYFDEGKQHMENYMYQDAVDCFSKSFDADNKNIEALSLLIEAEMENAMFDEALEHLQKLQDLGGDIVKIWKTKIDIHKKFGNKDKELECLIELTKVSDDVANFQEAARLLMENGSKEEAYQYLKKAIEGGAVLKGQMAALVLETENDYSDYERFSNSTFKLSIYYPKAWDKNEKINANKLFFSAVEPKTGQEVVRNFNISAANDQGADLEEWKKKIDDNIKEGGGKAVESEVKKVNNLDCIYNRIEMVQNNITISISNYVFLENGYMYTLFLFCSGDEYDDFIETKEKVVKSLSIE